MEFLEINKDDPIFTNDVSRQILYEAFIGKVKSPNIRAGTVQVFHDVAASFKSLTKILETVDIRYREFDERHDPPSDTFLEGSREQTFSYETYLEMGFFLYHTNPEYGSSIEKIPWYNALVQMVDVYNALLGAYMSRSDKIEEMAAHVEPYSRLPDDLEQCKAHIKVFAGTLELFLRGYSEDIDFLREISSRVRWISGGRRFDFNIRMYLDAIMLLRGFHALITLERKRRRRAVNEEMQVDETPVVKQEEEESLIIPQGMVDASLVNSGADAGRATAALVMAGISLGVFAGFVAVTR